MKNILQFKISVLLLFIVISVNNICAQKHILPLRPPPCAVTSISPAELYAGAAGGQLPAVRVYTEYNCTEYTVTENYSWISYTKSGLYVTITVGYNSGGARSGVVAIGNHLLEVLQDCGIAPGAAGNITGTNSVCQGQNGVSYSVGTIANATGYLWTLPTGGTIVSGNNTNSILVNYSSNAVSGNITVRGTGCATGSPSPNYYVTVNSIGQPGAISGSTSACAGNAYTYSISPVAGASSYSWTIPSGATGNSTTNSINVTLGSSSGTISVRANNSGCMSTSSSLGINVTTFYPFSVTENMTVCPGVFVNIGMLGSSNGVEYRCYKNDIIDGSLMGNGSSLYWSRSAPGTYTFKAVSGGCEVPMGTTILSNYTTSTQASSISGTTTICQGSSTTLTVVGGILGDGASWKWYTGGCGATLVNTGNSYTTPNLSVTTTYYVRAEGTCGLPTDCIPVTVTLLPLPTITQHPSNVTICDGAPTSFTVSAAGTNLVYQWQDLVGASWVDITGARSETFSIASTSGMYGRTLHCVVTDQCNYIATSNSAIISFSIPDPYSVTGTGAICPGGSRAVGLNDSQSGVTYTCYRDGSPLTPTIAGTGSAIDFGNMNVAGTYTVKGTTSVGCTYPMNGSAIISYNPLPTATVSGPTAVCKNTLNQNITFTGESTIPPYTFTYKINNASNIAVSTPSESPTVSVNVPTETAGTFTYTLVSVSDGRGCSQAQNGSATITINPLPTASISAPASVTLYSTDQFLTLTGSSGIPLYTFTYKVNNGTNETASTSAGSSVSVNLNTETAGTFTYTLVSVSDGRGCSQAQNGSATVNVINPYVDGNQTYTTTPVDPETRVLNTSYKPGSTSGNFNIDPMGNATYNISIDVPPGINGLTPSLSLVYSSANGPGIAGYGWDLAGLSVIDRGPQTYFYDGSYMGDLTDRFYIDGQRLASTSGQYGASGTIYQTSNDIFTRVTSQGVNEWFKAETKSGLIYEYGNALRSKETGIVGGNSIGLRWYVSKVSDLFSNQMDFSYFMDESLPYIGEITYGPNVITFYYKSRIDPIVFYKKGSKMQKRLILDKITVKYNNSIVKTYEMKYNFLYASRNILQMNEVIEYGTGTDRYNSTAFTYFPYEDISFSLTTPNTTHTDISNKSKMIPGDFNGDGKSDLLCLPDSSKGATWTGKRVYKSNGDDSFTLMFSDAENIYLNKLKDIRALDINGDGYDDIIYESGTSSISYFYYILNYGNSFSSPVLIRSIANNTSDYGFSGKTRRNEFQEDNELHGDDYTGDGMNDILISSPSGTGVIYSFVNIDGEKTSSLNEIGWIPLFGSQTFSGDFDGDGRSDIWNLYDNYVKIISFNYTNSTTLLKEMHDTLTKGSFFNLGDFNGDGKIDVFIYGSGRGGTPVNLTYWQTLLSTGKDFDTFLNPPLKSNLIGDNVRLGDFNDDGKTDLMANSSNQSWVGTKYFIVKNNGETFYTYTMNSEPSIANNFYLGDYNGDGHTDYITTIKQPSGVNGYNVFRTVADTALALKCVGNGLGQLTKVTYTKLSQAPVNVYNRGTGAVYPVTDYQGPLSVVSSLQNDNGIGTLNTHNFYYAGAKFQIQGKGFIGYERISDTDLATSIETVNISAYDPTYYYPQILKTFKRRASTTDTLEIVSSTWAERVLDPTQKRIFPYIVSSTMRNKLTGQSLTKTASYDNYGNPDTIITNYLNGPTQTTINSYNNTVSPTQWLLGRPTSTTLTYVSDTTITRSGTRVFDPNSNQLKTETWHSGTNNQIIQNYYYTPNGSLKRTKVTANGQDRISTYTYHSDSIRIATETDPLFHTITSRYDTYGRLTSKKDYLNNKDSLTYDNMNRVVNEYSTSGAQITTLYSWEDPLVAPLLARYSVQKTGNNGSVTKSYFDKLGREIRKDVKGFDGTMIHTDTYYNIKGQIDSISDPYSSGSAELNTYLYDNYGRITNLTRPSGRNSTWTYNSNSVTETTAGKSFTKTYSSDGTISSATDAGGTINYAYFPDGKVKEITAPGSITTIIKYDFAGNQRKLVDPSAGTIYYTYDGFGQLINQTNAGNQTSTITYYADGRLYTRAEPEGTTTYYYNSNKQLTSIVSPQPNTVERRFVYDTKGRVINVTDLIPGTSMFVTVYEYDTQGRLSTITHPSGIVETKNYNSFGYLSSINAGGADRWTTLGMNARQQVTTGKYGSNLNTTITYDNYGFLTSKVTGTIEDYSYNFDPANGNLNWRQNNKGSNLKENFYYDALDRLDNIYMGSTMTLDMAYEASKGAITTKTDAGTMLYDTENRPYQLSSINPATSLIPENTQNITYKSFMKVSTIEENNYNASFTYNSDHQRIKMSVLQGSNLVVTRWYPTGSFMKDSVSGSSKMYTFIGGDAYTAPCVAVREGTLTRYYYLLRDHLGSIIEISDSTNTKLYEYSYDAWGRMRNPSTWENHAPGSEPALFIGRGFTGHEHLPWFNLINMNGRVYDPLIGQFPSPDNQIQNPEFTQNYNRYAYCFNNPLKYIDPLGSEIWKPGVDHSSDNYGFDNFNSSNYLGYQGLTDYRYNYGSITSGGVTFTRTKEGVCTLSWTYNYSNPNPGYGVATVKGEDGVTRIEAYYSPGEVDIVSRTYSISFQPSGQGGKTLNNLSTINNIAAVVMDIAKESGYVATIGRTGYYSSGWNGNQHVKTLGVAKGLGYVFFGAGIVLDGTMYFTGQQSGAKTSLNIGVSTASLIIGGIPGIILGGGYFAVDKTVGWDRMMTPASNDQWVPNRAVFTDGTTIYVCFKAGTEILAKGSSMPIEQIVVGDSVYSYSLEKNAIELSKVVKSFERKTQEIYELTTDNQKIYVTAEHPFYVVGNGWVKVKDLQAGAVLKTKDGSIEHVINSVLEKHPETVYNIEVEGNHNYFVTNSNILVHNK